MKLLHILLASLLPSAALAQNQVSLNSEVFVEMTVRNPAVLNTSEISISVFSVSIPPCVCSPSKKLHGKNFITPVGRRMVGGREPRAE